MKYYFDGKYYKAINRTVLAVVNKYVEDHPTVTYNELLKVFPKELQGSIGILKNKNDYDEYCRTTETGEQRFFKKYPIKIDNDMVYVCTQWGSHWRDGREGNRDKFFNYAISQLGYNITIEDDEEKIKISKTKISANSTALNQILYGPPGTGKTYNTINKALEIIDGVVPKDRDEAKKRFESLKESGQIEFVTFHQSYGYEEFVEGIKAIPVGEEGNEDGKEMIYKIMPGIFKKLSKLAKNEYTKVSNTSKLDIKRYKLEAKSLNIQADMIQDNENSYRVLKGSKIRKGHAPSFYKYTYGDLKDKFLKYAKFKEEDEFYILNEDYTFQSMSASSSLILGRQSNGMTEWKEVINEENLFNQKDNIAKQSVRNYLLIIDEINRGNISKIFGELITLIEPSKRLGAKEALHVKLPYSGESFGVPSNLYIIGTMNTADRSIALMDTALRRRFEFTEMMPRPELLSHLHVNDVPIQSMLETINQRIEYLYDRDHTIGHAYFMELEDTEDKSKTLDTIMRNKVIPLLQEYFYDDWEKIRMILGDGFIEKQELKTDIFDEDVANGEYLEDEKFVYSIKETFDFSKFQR